MFESDLMDKFLGMDASVTPLPEEPHLSLVQTTDFFYPLIDDPYLQVDPFLNSFFYVTVIIINQ